MSKCSLLTFWPTYMPPNVGNLCIKDMCVVMMSILAEYVAIMNNCRTFRPLRSKQSNFLRIFMLLFVMFKMFSFQIIFNSCGSLLYIIAIFICSTLLPFCLIRVSIANYFF